MRAKILEYASSQPAYSNVDLYAGFFVFFYVAQYTFCDITIAQRAIVMSQKVAILCDKQVDRIIFPLLLVCAKHTHLCMIMLCILPIYGNSNRKENQGKRR